jgi:hypothetical protein
MTTPSGRSNEPEERERREKEKKKGCTSTPLGPIDNTIRL